MPGSGWYPQDDSRERFWNGERWTDQYRPHRDEPEWPPEIRERPRPGGGVLLVLVGLLAGVLGTLGVQHFTSSSGDGPVMLEDIPGYESAYQRAGYTCTLGGVVPGMTGLHDPAYIQCVEDETRSTLVEEGHPEAETAESRLD